MNTFYVNTVCSGLMSLQISAHTHTHTQKSTPFCSFMDELFSVTIRHFI